MRETIRNNMVPAVGLSLISAVLWPNFSPTYSTLSQKLQGIAHSYCPHAAKFLTSTHLIGLSVASLTIQYIGRIENLSPIKIFG